MLDNLWIKPDEKIMTYNIEFMKYISQLDWKDNILYYQYYQEFSNQIQNSYLYIKRKEICLFPNNVFTSYDY